MQDASDSMHHATGGRIPRDRVSGATRDVLQEEFHMQNRSSKSGPELHFEETSWSVPGCCCRATRARASALVLGYGAAQYCRCVREPGSRSKLPGFIWAKHLSQEAPRYVQHGAYLGALC